MLAGARRLLAPTAHARSHGTSRSIIKRSEGVVMFAIMLIWTDCAPTYASKAIGGHHAPPPPPRPPQFAWMCASPHASQRGRPERREHRLGHTGTSFTVNTRARRLPIATDRDTARHIARYREISPEIAPVYAPTTPLPQGSGSTHTTSLGRAVSKIEHMHELPSRAPRTVIGAAAGRSLFARLCGSRRCQS